MFCLSLIRILIITMLTIFVIIPSQVISGEGNTEGKVYFHLKSGSEQPTDSNITEFDLTRAYFGYKYKLDDQFSSRIMLDVARIKAATAVSHPTGGIVSLATNDSLAAYLKYGYLEWNNPIPMTKIFIGLHELNQFKVQEKFWSYRYVYKSFMDQNAMGSSSDLGISATIQPLEILSTTLTIVNGEGYKKSQDQDGKFKYAAGLTIIPINGLTGFVYYDYMDYNSSAKKAQTTMAAFLGYDFKSIIRLGAEYVVQENSSGTKNNRLNGISSYLTYVINSKYDVFARYDKLSSKNKWNEGRTSKSDGDRYIAGLQYKINSNVNASANYRTFNLKRSGEKEAREIFLNFEYKL